MARLPIEIWVIVNNIINDATVIAYLCAHFESLRSVKWFNAQLNYGENAGKISILSIGFSYNNNSTRPMAGLILGGNVQNHIHERYALIGISLLLETLDYLFCSSNTAVLMDRFLGTNNYLTQVE